MSETLASLKRLIKRLLPASVTKAFDNYRLIFWRLDTHERKLRNLSALLLAARYPALVAPEQFRDGINAHGFKVYSQNTEDGILLYLFSVLGVHNRKFIEIGVQDGRQCNTANLSLNFGWSGLLLEADALMVEAARHFYRDMLGLKAEAIRIAPTFVTAENINQLFAENGIEGEIDLLSIDVDGNDYWLWKAVSVVNPRVVIIEYNAAFGPARSVTTPYDPAFDVSKVDPHGIYHGASLTALNGLAEAKGYTLVGCDANGVNAFFVRRDLMAADKIRPMTPAEAYFPNSRLLSRGSTPEQQFAQIQHLPLVTVEDHRQAAIGSVQR